jgi:hypothetical protein
MFQALALQFFEMIRYNATVVARMESSAEVREMQIQRDHGL